MYKVAHERGGPQTLSPITFLLLRAASGPLDELQAAALGMPVGKQEVFLIVAEIGDILAHAAGRSTVWSQFGNRLPCTRSGVCQNVPINASPASVQALQAMPDVRSATISPNTPLSFTDATCAAG